MSAPAGTGPWEYAKPTGQPGQTLFWQEHWGGHCWSPLAKPRGGIARQWKYCRRGVSCQPSPLGAAGVDCAKARASAPGRNAWAAAGGKCTPCKAGGSIYSQVFVWVLWGLSATTHTETGPWHLCAGEAPLLMYLRPLRARGCSQGPALWSSPTSVRLSTV